MLCAVLLGMTSPNKTRRFVPDCPPNCPECATDDGGWAEVQAEFDQLLARHDAGCIAEAVQDAYDLGHDNPDGIQYVAAQLLEDGHGPCHCGQPSDPTIRPAALDEEQR